jgi:hypothetical protein
MKKLFLSLFLAGFLLACAGPGSQTHDHAGSEAQIEELLEQNIQLNERLGELEHELDSLINAL